MRKLSRSELVLLAALALAIVLLIIGTVWYVIVHREPSAAEIALGTGESAVYTDLEGREIAIAEAFTEVTVVTLWASWSPLSRDELPMLNALAEEYKNQGVSFVALNRSEPKDQAQRFLSTVPPLPALTIVIDQNDTYYKGITGYTMPETLIYDAEGNVVSHIKGVSNEGDLRATIDATLAN